MQNLRWAQRARRTRRVRRWKAAVVAEVAPTPIRLLLLLTFQSVSLQHLPLSHFLIRSPPGIRLRWSEDRTGASLCWCEEAKSSSAASPLPLMLHPHRGWSRAAVFPPSFMALGWKRHQQIILILQKVEPLFYFPPLSHIFLSRSVSQSVSSPSLWFQHLFGEICCPFILSAEVPCDKVKTICRNILEKL